ncbi:MAG: cytoskeleton protein RodZ [Gammaproteobacteria bacterium]|jgi:cytoskeleton protein RodZ
MNAPPEEVDATPDDGLGEGPGEHLRAARANAGLTLEEVSARLHLDKRTLDLLEADDFDKLPAPTFVRGYLRSYARMLDLPPGPIIEAFDRRGFAPPALIADIATGAETRSTDFWVVAGTIAILGVCVALASIWFQTTRGDEFEIVDTDPAIGTLAGEAADGASLQGEGSAGAGLSPSGIEPRNENAAGAGIEPRAGTGMEAGDNAVANGATGAIIDTAALDNAQGITPTLPLDSSDAAAALQDGITDPTGRIVDAAVADNGTQNPSLATQLGDAASDAATNADGQNSATASTGADASTSTAEAAPVRTGPIDEVAIRFSRDAWVELYDANNKKLYYNLARAGSRIEVKGVRPIRILLGYVRGVQMEYNNAPFDFSPYVAKGIARFEFLP